MGEPDVDRWGLVGQIIQGITYKPTARLSWTGTELLIEDTYLESSSLEPTVLVWEAGQPPIHILEAAPKDLARLVFDWVFENVALSELHEVAEFLRMNKEALHDPHGPNGCPVSVQFGFPQGNKTELTAIP